jgi:hypothetical protein
MKTRWRVTKNEKNLMNQIYKTFLYREQFAHIKFVFQNWLIDDINEIHIYKYGTEWIYLLADKNQSIDDTVVLDVKELLTTLN